MMPTPAFSPGDRVQLRSDRARVGVISAAPRRSGGEYWYRVQFLDGSSPVVPESDLEQLAQSASPSELLARAAFGDRDDLLRTTTFRKLNTPLDNTLYALRASRTQFYPHQYKPLIKFLDSKNHRLLIADEVGLGKTIEAGLILVELRARRALRQALIVCPKSLVGKWQTEMWRRFDEEFRILEASDLRRLLDDLHERGEIGELRGIISLQSLRQERMLELLEATPIPLDLVIFDEAHHLRNPGTISHRIAAALTETADAVLLLTATPIHLGNENLFHLLRLLDPSEFEDLGVFEERLYANIPVVEAERLVQAFPPPLGQIRDRLALLASGSRARYFRSNPLYVRLTERLAGTAEVTRDQVARLEHDLKELNLLGHVLTRTRKRDVFQSAARRTAQVLRPQPTPEELAFYRAVTEFVRDRADVTGGTAGYFAAITAQRQVASCMQAARLRFVERASEDVSDPDLSDLSDDLFLDDDHVDPALSPSERVVASAAALGDTDTKFDTLLKELGRLDDAEPGRKVIIFSYFKDTLRYLHRRLRERGLDCLLLTGDIRSDPANPERDERGSIMRRFQHDPAARILLSSDVGSEGLDFQFCHILVNYDLPWNPMRVEQRIGRLDRLGQESDRIIIINLSLPGTIEDRILHRLYARIGIFERSIGDLETIIGDEIGHLTRELLSRRLSTEEEEGLIDRAAQVIEKQRVMLERLEAESTKFVGYDRYFEEQLERARVGGEVLSSEDLRTFLSEFLAKVHPSSRLRREGKSIWILEVGDSLEAEVRRQPGDGPKFRFLKRLAAGGGKVRVSFDSESAFEDDEIEFLAAHHPLLQLAVTHYREHTDELHSVSALTVEPLDGVDEGDYLYILCEVEVRSGRVRKRLEPLFVCLETGEPLSEQTSSRLLGHLLKNGTKWENPPDYGPEDTPKLLQWAEDLFLSRIADRRRDMVDRNAALVQTRLVSLQSAHEARLRKKQLLLDNARRSGRQERYIRMIEGTIRNMLADYAQRRSELEAERTVDISFELVGCGLVRVEAKP